MMNTEQGIEPLSAKSVRYRLATLIEATALPVYSLSQAQELVKNVNEDLRLIKASIELNERTL